MLEGKLSVLRAYISDKGEALNSGGGRHLGSESSPLSVYSRVKGARSALLGECEKLSRMRAASLQGCVELYWLSRWMDVQLETLWVGFDLEETRRRESACVTVSERFAQLIPRSMFASFEKAAQSPGAVAVAVAEAQGKNTDLATRLGELDACISVQDEELFHAEIAAANMEAAGLLAEFEWNTLMAPPPYPALPTPARASQDALKYGLEPVLRGFPAIGAATKRHAELEALATALETQVALVKQSLSRGIDSLERSGPTPEAARILAECREACNVGIDV